MDDSGMPLYWCHKTVRAVKILNILHQENGGALITPDTKQYAPFYASPDFIIKHEPKEGGYYVWHEDGHISYLPAEAFESGYSLMVGSDHGDGLKTRKDPEGMKWHSLDFGELDLRALQLAVKFTLDNHDDLQDAVFLSLRDRLFGRDGTIQ